MKNTKALSPESDALRQKAEDQLKKSHKEKTTHLIEADMMRLLHELQVWRRAAGAPRAAGGKRENAGTDRHDADPDNGVHLPRRSRDALLLFQLSRDGDGAVAVVLAELSGEAGHASPARCVEAYTMCLLSARK